MHLYVHCTLKHQYLSFFNQHVHQNISMLINISVCKWKYQYLYQNISNTSLYQEYNLFVTFLYHKYELFKDISLIYPYVSLYIFIYLYISLYILMYLHMSLYIFISLVSYYHVSYYHVSYYHVPYYHVSYYHVSTCITFMIV